MLIAKPTFVWKGYAASTPDVNGKCLFNRRSGYREAVHPERWTPGKRHSQDGHSIGRGAHRWTAPG
jgi:hypothetical protein